MKKILIILFTILALCSFEPPKVAAKEPHEKHEFLLLWCIAPPIGIRKEVHGKSFKHH